MDAQLLTQGTLLVRSVIDLATTLVKLVPRRTALPETIPVYRLVSREDGLRRRADVAIDITPPARREE